MSSNQNPDVIVVGAGPVGLVAGCELARRGVRVRVIDKLAQPTEQSRAIAVHARSLDMFDRMGIVDEMIGHRHQGHRDADVRRTAASCSASRSVSRQRVPVHLDHGADRNRARARRAPAVTRGHRRARCRVGRADPGRRRRASHLAARRRINRAGQRLLGDRRRRRAQHGATVGRHQARRFLRRRTLPAR